MMQSACLGQDEGARPIQRQGPETIRLAAGSRLVPTSLLEPPFSNDRGHILHEQAAVLLDRHLRRLARMHCPVELHIARLLGRMKHLSACLDLGFARLSDYAVERLGLRTRRTQILLQMDRRLRDLPATTRAFEAGRISPSQVRLLVRVATPDTERTWLDKAAGKNVKQLEREVRRARAAAARQDAGADAAQGAPGAPAVAGPAAAGDPSPAVPAVDPAPIDEDSEEPHVSVSLPAPAWVRGRWDWAVEVYRRTAGAASPVWEAAEGFAAEYLAGYPGPLPGIDQSAGDAITDSQLETGIVEESDDRPDDDCGCPQDDGIDLFEEVQRALEDEMGASKWAPPVADIEVILPSDLDSLESGNDGAGNAASLDHRLRGLIKLRQNLAWHQGRLLRTFANYRLHRVLGFSSFSRYCRENLGMSVRRAHQLIALERRLLELPELALAYHEGRLSWVKASEIARVANERTEKEWIHLGESVTVRRLCEEVARAAADLDDMDAPWHPRRGAPPGLTDDGRVQLCTPFVQPPPMPPSPNDGASAPIDASTPVSPPDSAAAPVAGVQSCAPEPGAESIAGSAPTVAANDPGVKTCARVDAITTRIRFRAPLKVAQIWRHALTACRALEGGHLEDWECVAIMLESFRRTWEFRGSPAWQRRYRIFERDGWRCRVPGCSSRRNLQAHHIVFLSRGGGQGDDNLVTLCVTHHLRCLHSGTLRCHRLPDGLLAWELGTSPGEAAETTDTSTVGSTSSPTTVERYVEDVLWQAARASVRSIFEEKS